MMFVGAVSWRSFGGLLRNKPKKVDSSFFPDGKPDDWNNTKIERSILKPPSDDVLKTFVV